MNTPDTDLLDRATALTRQGNLAGATALIQQALGGISATNAAPASVACDSIGIPGRRQAAQRPIGTYRATTRTGHVFDSEVVDTPDTQSVVDAQVPRQSIRGDVFTGASFTYGSSLIDYQLYTPPPQNQPAPLLVMLHGCTQDAADFARGTAMNALARDAGYYVLYPSQDTQANPNRCWNWFNPAHQHRGNGEPALLSALTQQIAASHSIDSRRTFIAGLSAGGAMAVIMGQQYPELFAGVGVHSGLPAGAARNLPEALSAMQGRTSGANHFSSLRGSLADAGLTMKRFSPLTGHATPTNAVSTTNESCVTRPTIVLHGTEDRTVDPSNAKRIVDACVQPDPSAHSHPHMHKGTSAGRSYRCHVYRDENQQVVCEHWELVGTGHHWSGGNASGTHTDPSGPSASAEMLRFFDQCAPLPVGTSDRRAA